MVIVRVIIASIGMILVAYAVMQLLPAVTGAVSQPSLTLGEVATDIVRGAVRGAPEPLPPLSARRVFVAGHTPNGEDMQFQIVFQTTELTGAARNVDTYLAFHGVGGFAPVTPGHDFFLDRAYSGGGIAVGLSRPRESRILPESCTATGPASVAFGGGIFLRHPTVCRIASSREGGRDALVGLVWPEEAALPLPNGQTLCVEEVRNWLEMEQYQDVSVAACLLVDRPQMDRGLDRFAVNWADVMVFQRTDDNRLSLLSAEPRNFR